MRPRRWSSCATRPPARRSRRRAGRRARARSLAGGAGRRRRPRELEAPRQHAAHRAARCSAAPRALRGRGRVARLPRAPAGGALAVARTSPRSPSAPSPTRRSAPPTSSAPSTSTSDPATRGPVRRSSTSASRRTRRRPGSAPSRSASCATTARSTRSHGNVNWMRAREGNFGSTDDGSTTRCSTSPAPTRRCSTTRSSFLVHGGRDVRHALSMLIPPAWEGNDGARPQEVRDFHRYHAGLDRAVGRPGRARLHGRAHRRRGPRPQRPAPAPLRRLRGRARRLLVGGGRDPAVEGDGQVRRGQARARPDDRRRPGARIRGTTSRSSGGLRPRSAVRAWLERGLVAGLAGAPLARPDADLTAAPGALRLHPRGAERASCARSRRTRTTRPTRWATTRRSPPLAGRATSALPLLQAALRAGHEPADRPPARAVRDVAAHGARRPRPAPRRRARRSRPGIELESFFLFPDALERARPRARDSTRRSRPRRALEQACDRLADEAEAAVRAGAGMLLVSDTAARPGPRSPRCSPTGVVHQRLVGARLAHQVRRSSSRATSRGRCTTSLPPRLRRRGDLPRLALETLAAMAAADKIGGDRPSPDEAQVRFREAIEDGVLKVMSKIGISDVASYCGAQTLRGDRPRPGGRRPRLRRARPAPIGGHRPRRARARDRSSATRRRGRREAARSRTPATSSGARAASRTRRAPDVVEALHEMTPRTRCRGGDPDARGASAVRPVRLARQRPRRRWSPATCSSSFAAGAAACRSTRSSRSRRSCGASRAARCRTARCRPRRTRRSRSRSTGSARRANSRRGRRGSRPLPRRAQLRRSSRSRRGASASRPSTPPARRSCRSRSRRARSPARAASIPATR